MSRTIKTGRVRRTALSLAATVATFVLVAAECGESELVDGPTPTVAAEVASPSPMPPPTDTATTLPPGTAVLSVTGAPTAPATPTASPTPSTTPEPPPSPEPTATATATPTPTPTATPTPTPADFDEFGFSPSRFVEVLGDDPPGAIRMTADIASSFGDGRFAMVIESMLSDNAMRLVLDFGPEDRRVRVEMITIGSNQYITAVDAAGNQLPWVTSTISEDGAAPLGELTGAVGVIEGLEAADGDLPFITVGREACLTGGECFVLENPHDPSIQVLVDVVSYLPVMLRGRISESDSEATVPIEWGTRIDIEAPANARTVTPEEFATTMFSLFIGLSIDGSDESMGVERDAFFTELGAPLGVSAPDDANDLFHGDPTIAPVRYDASVDIWEWGAGLVRFQGEGAAELFGPNGRYKCGSQDPVVVCGNGTLESGVHVLVWGRVARTVPPADNVLARTYWATFGDGNPSNGFAALPQFENEVLEDSDVQYWAEWRPGGWSLRRTFGPQLEPSGTAALVMILGDTVVFAIPVSELGDLGTRRIGFASFSGPVINPFGVDATSDRAPDVRQSLTPLAEVLSWQIDYGAVSQTSALSDPQALDCQTGAAVDDSELRAHLRPADVSVAAASGEMIFTLTFGQIEDLAGYLSEEEVTLVVGFGMRDPTSGDAGGDPNWFFNNASNTSASAQWDAGAGSFGTTFADARTGAWELVEDAGLTVSSDGGQVAVSVPVERVPTNALWYALVYDLSLSACVAFGIEDGVAAVPLPQG